MNDSFKFLVGIDWATTQHEVRLLDAAGISQGARSVAHSGDGLEDLCTWLIAFGAPAEIAVAIEVPHGAVVETLLERGFAVFAINPKQLDRFRDRFTNAGAKDDRLDALVLAGSLRTDPHCYRRLTVEPATLITLREHSRIHDDLQAERTQLGNRMREQLRRYFPAMLDLVGEPTEWWATELWELVPTPAAAQSVAKNRVTRLLAKRHIRRVDADTVLTKLRAKPLHVAAGTTEAATAHIALLIERIRVVLAQIKKCRAKLEQLIDQLAGEDRQGQTSEQRDVAIILSMPGIGLIVLAMLLAEAASLLRARDYHGLRALGGAAPVTRQSGKRRVVLMRTACNPRLRNALYHWARVASQRDKLTKDRYDALRRRGKSHGQALRTVADRLLAVLCAMLRNQTEYRAPTLDAA